MRTSHVNPGEIIVGSEPVQLFAGLPVLTLVVANTGDRPIPVGERSLVGLSRWSRAPLLR